MSTLDHDAAVAMTGPALALPPNADPAAAVARDLRRLQAQQRLNADVVLRGGVALARAPLLAQALSRAVRGRERARAEAAEARAQTERGRMLCLEDEVEKAKERMREILTIVGSERLTRDAEEKIVQMELQVGEGVARVKEVEVDMARNVAEVEQRVMEAAGRVQVVEKELENMRLKIASAEAALQAAETKSKAFEEKANAGKQKSIDAETKALTALKNMSAIVAEAKAADVKAKAANARAKAACEKAKAADAKVKTAEDKARAADDNSRVLEVQARSAEERAAAAEEKAKAADARIHAAEEKLSAVQRPLTGLGAMFSPAPLSGALNALGGGADAASESRSRFTTTLPFDVAQDADEDEHKDGVNAGNGVNGSGRDEEHSGSDSDLASSDADDEPNDADDTDGAEDYHDVVASLAKRGRSRAPGFESRLVPKTKSSVKARKASAVPKIKPKKRPKIFIPEQEHVDPDDEVLLPSRVVSSPTAKRGGPPESSPGETMKRRRPSDTSAVASKQKRPLLARDRCGDQRDESGGNFELQRNADAESQSEAVLGSGRSKRERKRVSYDYDAPGRDVEGDITSIASLTVRKAGSRSKRR
jgi:hypothetical protein